MYCTSVPPLYWLLSTSVVPMHCICITSVLSLPHLCNVCTASVLPLSPALLYLVLSYYTCTILSRKYLCSISLPYFCQYLLPTNSMYYYCTTLYVSTSVLHLNYLQTASVLHHYVCTTSVHYLFLPLFFLSLTYFYLSVPVSDARSWHDPRHFRHKWP
jgi:hypothetical protein